MQKIIEVSNLKKSYGEVKAVDGISFYAEQGKLFAFLGPNGAGKSTTIEILCTLLACDASEVVIAGHTLGRDDAAIRTDIGVVFQDNTLDRLLTIKENLMARGSLYGLSKSQLKASLKQAAEATGITELLDRPYGKLSGGQRRRADIARALIHTPKILFLDEPTTGLDPQTRRNIWETIQRLQREHGLTVFLTTHYMEEAAQADYVVVIDSGRIAAAGSPTELKQQYSRDTLRLRADDPKRLEEPLRELGLVYTVSGKTIIVELKSTVDCVDILARCRGLFTNVEVLNGTMDDAFINITGKELRDGSDH